MLPVWDGADPSNIGLVMRGVAVMLSGVLDHRLFVAHLRLARAACELEDAMSEPEDELVLDRLSTSRAGWRS